MKGDVTYTDRLFIMAPDSGWDTLCSWVDISLAEF